ncbi:MAG TPA: hypothetical protein VJ673_08170 [Aromatoleum sp.]|uniref:hypothetical protein n=1 Tax=Aromatoleum sp. TaxID=2307007 RepID=UPI002B47F9D0|nr:hypothetical protein [Aromatoleum sp.]HJV25649.1 hypothetical protein [Aromatoleum sp.]
MKWIKCVIALLLLMGLVIPEVASADRGGRGHGGGGHVGLFVGVPLYWGWPGPYYAYPPYYGYPSYYYPYPPVVIEQQPPVYIERSDDETSSRSSARPEGYWYYCDRPAGYYPDVKECPDGWQRVAPRPSR